MNTNLNYYELLGVKQNASEEEIKNAYKTQMKKWHPDINKSDDAITISTKLNEAKEILLDPVKRKDYDDYLNSKIHENYNKYTKTKQAENNNKNETYEDNKVTKWQYLKDWIKYAKIPVIRKIIGLIGVLLESFMCWLIKIILIIIAYICNVGSNIIKTSFYYISPLLGFLAVILFIQISANGFINFFRENSSFLKLIIIILTLFVSSFLLPYLSNLLLSAKTFDILYNKIDINLFKLCVDYKD